ncbi:TniQ family protein [Streptomyces albidoflavus]
MNIPQAQKDSFAQLTRLAPEEVTELTLSQWRDRYPPIARSKPGTGPLSWSDPWIFLNSPRSCPACLAGDGTPAQQLHGGPWRKMWYLPIAFTCTVHQEFLMHGCAYCDQPGGGLGRMVQRANDHTLHPAQCRWTPDGQVQKRKTRACGHRLDNLASWDPDGPQPTSDMLNSLGAAGHRQGRIGVLHRPPTGGRADHHNLAAGPAPVRRRGCIANRCSLSETTDGNHWAATPGPGHATARLDYLRSPIPVAPAGLSGSAQRFVEADGIRVLRQGTTGTARRESGTGSPLRRSTGPRTSRTAGAPSPCRRPPSTRAARAFWTPTALRARPHRASRSRPGAGACSWPTD